MTTEQFKTSLEQMINLLNEETGAKLMDIGFEYGETLTGKGCISIDLTLYA